MYNAVKDRIENVNGNKQMLQNFMLFRRKHKNCDNNNNRHDEITNLIKTKWNNKTTRERAGGGATMISTNFLLVSVDICVHHVL